MSHFYKSGCTDVRTRQKFAKIAMFKQIINFQKPSRSHSIRWFFPQNFFKCPRFKFLRILINWLSLSIENIFENLEILLDFFVFKFFSYCMLLNQIFDRCFVTFLKGLKWQENSSAMKSDWYFILTIYFNSLTHKNDFVNKLFACTKQNHKIKPIRILSHLLCLHLLFMDISVNAHFKNHITIRNFE